MASGNSPEAGKLGSTLATAMTVARFLKSRPKVLDRRSCLRLVEEAIVLLDGLYVHLPQKRALYGVDPVSRLRSLRQSMIDDPRPAAKFKDLPFHREMVDAFTMIRDLHTMYILPEPFDRSIAFLPFRIEACYTGAERRDADRRFILTIVDDHLLGPERDEGFMRGAQVTHWNGIPVAEAVERVGAQNSGSNPDARIARGLARLTARPLARALPPDEEGVTVRYLDADGEPGFQHAPWRVATFPTAAAVPSGLDLTHALAEGLDHETHLISTVNKLLSGRMRTRSSPAVGVVPGADTQVGPDTAAAQLQPGARIGVGPALRDNMQAQVLDIGGVRYGYIRLYSFKIPDETALEAFVAVLEKMPEAGLILDIRDNPGGCLQRAEQLLQTLTPARIEPAPTQIINTPTSMAVCKALPRFRPWADSIGPAEGGASFSSGLPLSDAIGCNQVGQRYYGPVVLITNAICFSSADIFAAGFQDHGIGAVLGVDTTTGAGGAEVVTHSFLCDRHKAARAAARNKKRPAGAAPDAERWPLSKLEHGDFRLAIRRTLRVRDRAGNVLEDLGVVSTIIHPTTRNDLLDGNVDLLRRAAEYLAGQPSYVLKEQPGTFERSEKGVTFRVRTRGFDRLEMALDSAISPSINVGDGWHTVTAKVPLKEIATHLTLRGLKNGRTVAARRIRLPPMRAGAAEATPDGAKD